MSPTVNPLRSLFGALMFTAMMLVVVAGLKSYRDLAVARQRESTFEARIEEARQRLEVLEGRIELLRNDPATLERLAREQRGLVMPDDLVVVLPPGDGE